MICEKTRLPVPKLGPPLNALPDHKWPCITPALTNSRNRYKESWNLSFTRAVRIAVCMARANGECVWVFNRNLLVRQAHQQIVLMVAPVIMAEMKAPTLLVQENAI